MTQPPVEGGWTPPQHPAPPLPYGPPPPGSNPIDESRRRFLESTAVAPNVAPITQFPPAIEQRPPQAPPTPNVPAYEPFSLSSARPSAGRAADTMEPIDSRSVEDLHGWRRFVAALGVPVKVSAAEMEHDRLVSGVRVDTRHAHIIGVVSGRGGTGKTTLSYLLGDTLARYRTGSATTVVSIDHNGSLARRVIDVGAASGNIKPVSSLVKLAHDEHLRDDSAYLSHMLTAASGVRVIGSSRDTGSAPITPAEYVKAMQQLQTRSPIIVVDFGNTPDSPVFRSALEGLSALVMVAATEKDSVESSVDLLSDIYDGSVYGLGAKLKQRTLVLLNQRSADRPRITTDSMVTHINKTLNADSASSIVTIPWDEHLATASRINPKRCTSKTTHQVLVAASTVVGMLPRT